MAIFWRKNSGAMALFDDGTLNKKYDVIFENCNFSFDGHSNK